MCEMGCDQVGGAGAIDWGSVCVGVGGCVMGCDGEVGLWLMGWRSAGAYV